MYIDSFIQSKKLCVETLKRAIATGNDADIEEAVDLILNVNLHFIKETAMQTAAANEDNQTFEERVENICNKKCRENEGKQK